VNSFRSVQKGEPVVYSNGVDAGQGNSECMVRGLAQVLQ